MAARMHNLGRLFGTFVITLVVGGLAVGACFAALIPGTVDIVTAHQYTVHQVKELSALSEKSTVYWNDGSTQLGELGYDDRSLVNLSEVPVSIQNAIIATEDRSFWTNDGIDLGAVFRAFLTNVVSGEISQGGSTITQQLVKNRILTPKRDVNRKIRELEDALRLNEKFSKEKILEEYLNTIYFGSGSYGIKAAARRFFVTPDPGSLVGFRGKTMAELTIGETALLAGLISSPEGNNPFTYPDRAIRRRADVLRAEVEAGYITQVQSDAANLEPLPVIPPSKEIRPENYLVAEVQDRLLQDPRLGNTPEERRNKLLKGGLKITTTFDPRLQTIAQDATDNAKPQKGDDWVSSLVSLEPATGAVRAMIGGPDFGSSQYNIATHTPGGRQPGSTWKVITLAAALQNGYSARDTVSGASPCSIPSKFPASASTRNSNESEGGTGDLFLVTAQSVNCAFVRLSTSVGQDKVMAMGHAMGLTQDNLQDILTLSIGTVEATPLEMATVIGTVANFGVHQTPYVVQKVVDAQGTVLIDETGRPGNRVLDESVAACEQNILRGVITGGTGGNAGFPGHTPYGKTGTTDTTADAWFIGATPQLATAVWFGNRTGNVGGAGYGGDSAAPIFRAFMSAALDGQPNLGLPDPGPVCSRAGQMVNEAGGRGGAVFVPAPVSDAPAAAPEQPTVQQLPAPTATVPPVVTPVTPAPPATP
jgi:membrane peptidoglycan carboxypeptidase